MLVDIEMQISNSEVLSTKISKQFSVTYIFFGKCFQTYYMKIFR